MFYAHFVLAKKGPLSRIWLAAHWDKKLTRAHVFEINIESSVEGILQPKVKMALRTSGHLLLGIVRIYSRKAKYLLADCNEAFIKIKMAFRPGVVDLPEGNREAAVATITLPEVFHDFDSAMPDIAIDMDAQVTLNQSRAEDITIKEDYGTLSLINDDFDDMQFDDPEVVHDASNIDEGFDQAGLMLDNRDKSKLEENLQSTSSAAINKENIASPPMKENLFLDEVADALLDDNDAGEIFETGGLFEEPLEPVPMDNPEQAEIPPPVDKPPVAPDDSDDDMYDMGPASMGLPSPPSSPETPNPAGQADAERKPEDNSADFPDGPSALPNIFDDLGTPAPVACSTSSATETMTFVPDEMPPPSVPEKPETFDHPPFGHNDDESFALAPLDAIMQGAERTVKAKRKRKLIVDEVKNISGEEIKLQLSDTSDIVTSLDLAPPTKRLMHWKETGGVEKLFALPGHPILSKTLSRLYQRHLTTRSVENEELGFEDGRIQGNQNEEDKIVLDPDFEKVLVDEDAIARKRRRETDPGMPQDLTHVNPMHLDRSSFSNGSGMPQHSLGISADFLPQHSPMFHPIADLSQPQQMSPIMPPPAHMLHQILPPDISPLSHGSQMMQSPGVMVDPMSQLQSLTQNMCEMVPPGLPEFTQPTHPSVIESVSQHLMSNSLPSVVENQSVIETPLPPSPLMNQIQNDLLQDHVSVDKAVATDDKEAKSCANGPLENGDANKNDVVQPQPFFDDQLHFDRQAVPLNEVDQSIMQAENNGLCVNEQDQQLSAIPFTTTSDNIADGALLHSVMQNGNDVAPVQIHPEQQPEQSDDDDYGAPSSVGPIPEEQMEDETYEQFEERILTKRTTHMLHIIHNQLENDREVKFSGLTRSNKRKQVAQKFYTFLVLKKQQAVELQQNGPYDDLIITKGPKFDAVYNAN